MKFRIIAPVALILVAVLFGGVAAAEVKHVVVYGVDGMSPIGVQRATTPNFNEMIATGAFSFHARGVLTTSSSQNWASMIMGAGPEQHGITSNGWERDKYSIEPTTSGMEEIFPTIFSVLRQQFPKYELGAIYDWGGFGRLFEKSAVNHDEKGNGPEDTVAKAVAYLKAEKPEFLFIHVDHVDHALHSVGFGSDDYYDAVEVADKLFGDLRQGIADAGMAEDTLVIVTADHGGVGTHHGGESMAEIEIPWMIVGPGIKAGREITDPINTYDTAATAAHALGAKQPYHWIARPVLSAFEGQDDQAPAKAHPDYLPMPRVHPEGGPVEEAGKSITMTVDAPKAVIRFTTDGSIPTEKSAVYEHAISLDAPGTVTAMAFGGPGAMSAPTVVQFTAKAEAGN